MQNLVRYGKLGYVALNVSDLERSDAFYRDMVGLQPLEPGADGCRRFRCLDEDNVLALYESSEPGLKYVGIMLESADQVPALQKRLQDADVAYVELSPSECSLRGAQRAIRVQAPGALLTLEFYVAAEGVVTGDFKPSVARIQRLGHVVVRTPDYEKATHFLLDVLNFRASDMVETSLTLMRYFPNPFHHGFGIARAPGEAGFHHLNFMVTEIDDVGRALQRFLANGVPVVYGPGRHPISTSIFIYYLDPDGLTLEYSFGMEEFPELGAREPRVVPRVPEWSDAWGGRPDPRMGKTGGIERAIVFHSSTT